MMWQQPWHHRETYIKPSSSSWQQLRMRIMLNLCRRASRRHKFSIMRMQWQPSCVRRRPAIIPEYTTLAVAARGMMAAVQLIIVTRVRSISFFSGRSRVPMTALRGPPWTTPAPPPRSCCRVTVTRGPARTTFARCCTKLLQCGMYSVCESRKKKPGFVLWICSYFWSGSTDFLDLNGQK